MKGKPPPYPLPGDFVDTARPKRRRMPGSVVGLLVFIFIGPFVIIPVGMLVVWLVMENEAGHPSDVGSTKSPFTFGTFFEEDPHFTMRVDQTVETYDRTGRRTLGDAAGCLAGAKDAATRSLLATLGCDGRIEVSFTTPGKAQVSVHVLRLRDEAAGRTAEQRLKAEGMRFVTATAVPQRIGARFGKVGAGSRYAVVTAAVSPPQRNARLAVTRGGGFIHAETTNVTLWL